MAITKIQAGALPADVITTAAIDDASITHAKLHTTMDLSSKTVTLPTLSTLNTSGNVGIGTSSPAYPLEVQSGGVGTVLRAGASFVSIDSVGSESSPSLILNGDGDTGLYHPAANTLAISTFGTERMRIDSAGRLSLGPDASDILIDPASTNSNNNLIYMRGNASGDKSSIQMNHYGNADYHIGVGHVADGKFNIANDPTGNDFVIDTSGNVGIGETTPLGKLHVKTADSGATANSSADELVVEGSSNAGISILSGASNTGSIYFGDSGTNWDGYVAYSQSSRSMTLGTAAGSGSIVIDSSGKLKVGNDKPIWSGSYGGALFLKGNNATADRYAQLAIVDSTGAIANNGLIVTNDGEVLINTTSSNDDPSKLRVSSAMSNLGGVFVGHVHNSSNNNSEALLMHRLDGNSVGFQFSGEIYCNSWTGQAHVNFNATARYNDDHVTWFKNSNGVGSGVSEVQLRLATISYASGSYLAVIKDGGGTGVFYINGFLGGNMDSNGGVRAVAAGQYTVTTTHVNLN